MDTEDWDIVAADNTPRHSPESPPSSPGAASECLMAAADVGGSLVLPSMACCDNTVPIQMLDECKRTGALPAGSADPDQPVEPAGAGAPYSAELVRECASDSNSGSDWSQPPSLHDATSYGSTACDEEGGGAASPASPQHPTSSERWARVAEEAGVSEGASPASSSHAFELAAHKAEIMRQVGGGADLVPPPFPAPVPHQYYNLLVVGDPGAGKSLLISNLLGPLPTSMCIAQQPTFAGKVKMAVHRATVACPGGRAPPLIYAVHEVEGGLMFPQLRRLEALLIGTCERYFEMEQDPNRPYPFSVYSQALDNRFDACLLLLPPHGLRPRHIKAAKVLSKLVPVIPIIGKADSCTPAELEGQRATVRDALGLRTPALYCPLAAGCDPELLSVEAHAAGLPPGHLPLAAIVSEEVDESMGSFWPVRRYQWGICETFSSEQSDMRFLRQTLATGAASLRAASELRYLSYRTQRLAQQPPATATAHCTVGPAAETMPTPPSDTTDSHVPASTYAPTGDCTDSHVPASTAAPHATGADGVAGSSRKTAAGEGSRTSGAGATTATKPSPTIPRQQQDNCGKQQENGSKEVVLLVFLFLGLLLGYMLGVTVASPYTTQGHQTAGARSANQQASVSPQPSQSSVSSAAELLALHSRITADLGGQVRQAHDRLTGWKELATEGQLKATEAAAGSSVEAGATQQLQGQKNGEADVWAAQTDSVEEVGARQQEAIEQVAQAADVIRRQLAAAVDELVAVKEASVAEILKLLGGGMDQLTAAQAAAADRLWAEREEATKIIAAEREEATKLIAAEGAVAVFEVTAVKEAAAAEVLAAKGSVQAAVNDVAAARQKAGALLAAAQQEVEALERKTKKKKKKQKTTGQFARFEQAVAAAELTSAALKNQLHAGLEQANIRLESMLQARLEAVASELDGVLDGVDSSLAVLEQRVLGLEAGVSDIKQELQSLLGTAACVQPILK